MIIMTTKITTSTTTKINNNNKASNNRRNKIFIDLGQLDFCFMTDIKTILISRTNLEIAT